jgi:hypothetical protein
MVKQPPTTGFLTLRSKIIVTRQANAKLHNPKVAVPGKEFVFQGREL